MTIIWNHHETCIQISANIPGIGSLIREIDVKMSEMLERKILWICKINARLLSVK